MSASRRQLLRAAAGLSMLGGLAGFRTARASTSPLRLGALLPRTGYLASAGNACFQGVQLARQLFASADLPALAVIEGDTGESAESALAAAARVMDAGAHLLIGCYDSAQTVAVAAWAERHGVPLIINIGAAPSITEQGYRYVFRNFPDAHRIVADSYALQKELFHQTRFTPRKLVVLYINNGRGIETIQELFPSMHMPYEMGPAIAYDPKAEDLSKEVRAARESGADALWTVSRADDAVRITRELVKQAWCPAAIMSSNAGLHEASYRQALGRYADYAITFAPYYDPNKPLSRRLLRLQRRIDPTVVIGTLQVYTFEAVLIALDAYKRARSLDGAALSAALRKTHIKDNVTAGPGIAFDERGQNEQLSLVAIQNLQGEGRVVLPRAAAQARAILPMPAWTAMAEGVRSA